MRRRLFLLILLVAVSGCAGLTKYREPVRVTVSNVRIVEATMLEQLYVVTLRVQNHNATPISIRGGSFDLELNGRDFGSGVTDQQLVVPAYSDATLEVRMVSTMFGMLRLFQSLQDRAGGALDYEISGRFSLTDEFGGVDFHEKGEFSLPGKPGSGT